MLVNKFLSFVFNSNYGMWGKEAIMKYSFILDLIIIKGENCNFLKIRKWDSHFLFLCYHFNNFDIQLNFYIKFSFQEKISSSLAF